MSTTIPLPELPLDQLSLDQKVLLRDRITDSIWNHEEAGSVGDQPWHEQVLMERAKLEETGELALLEVDEVFDRLLTA